MAQYPQRSGGETAAPEDCRDYLRTGRCKYGVSCKYNHPPNVQSGGGIKTPLNPSEPPFPIRPNEPPCQYYLKHGTCKFGQACKFHHPPHLAASAPSAAGLATGGTLLMNLNPSGSLAVEGNNSLHQIFLNATGTDGGTAATTGVILQLLPQRPGEPDCIYFLRNGRCKYGATCRYHHPLNYHNRDGTGGRRQQQQQQHSIQIQLPPQLQTAGRGRSQSTGSAADGMSNRAAQSVQYISQSGHGGGFRQSGRGPSHILLADGQVALVAVNQHGGSSAGLTSLQRAATAGSGGNVGQYYVQREDSALGSNITHQEHSPPIGASPIVTSSSVASSYDTAISGSEFLPSSSFHGQQQQQLQNDSQGSIWDRSNSYLQLSPYGDRGMHTSGSGGALSAYAGSETSHQSSQGNSQQHSNSSLRRALEGGSDHHLRHHAGSYGSMGSSNENIIYSSASRTDSRFNKDRANMRGWPSSSSLSPPSIDSASGGANTRAWDESGVSGQARYSRDSRYNRSGAFLSTSAPEHLPDYDQRHGSFEDDSSPPASLHSSHGNNSRRQHRDHSGNYDDDGLSMMTTALLSMLDTQDEDHSGDATRSPRGYNAASRRHPSSAPSTPREGRTTFVPLSASMSEEMNARGGISSSGLPQEHGAMRQYSRMSFNPNHPRTPPPANTAFPVDLEGTEEQSTPVQGNDSTSRWFPTWQPSTSTNRRLEQNAQSMSVLQQSPAAAPHSSNNIGLYLP